MDIHLVTSRTVTEAQRRLIAAVKDGEAAFHERYGSARVRRQATPLEIKAFIHAAIDQAFDDAATRLTMWGEEAEEAIEEERR